MTTAAAVRERPILFSGPMVRAILDGRKTQTRRVVTGRTALEWLAPGMFVPSFVVDPGNYLSPFGYAGDLLWVRETWARQEGTRCFAYRADGECGAWMGDGDGGQLWNRHGWVLEGENVEAEGPSWGLAKFGGRWHPSIHMPKWAARIWLRVTDVRVERLMEITEADAKREGFEDTVTVDHSTDGRRSRRARRSSSTSPRARKGPAAAGVVIVP